jgi:DNA-binding transcriptional LysR family regulator
MADIRNVDLNLLRALEALLDERSVSRAAQRLALTQSTVSGMLARLRQMFDDPLFVRTQRGILPTPRAEALAGPLRQLLADADALVAPNIFDPARSEATLSIAVNDYMQRALLVPFIAALRREAPRLRLAVKPPVIEEVADRLAQKDIDLAVTIPEFAAADLPSRRLYSERYVAVIRPQHPLADKLVGLAAFCAFDHLLVSPTGGAFEGPTDRALARLGARRNVRYSLPSFLVLLDVLQTDDLIAVVPERLLSGGAGAYRTFVPPVDIPGFDVIAVWHARVHRDPAHRWLRQKLAEVAGTLGR